MWTVPIVAGNPVDRRRSCPWGSLRAVGGGGESLRAGKGADSL